MKNDKNIFKSRILIMVAALLLMMKPISAKADEQISANTLLILNDDASVKETANTNSVTVGELESGTGVISLEESANGWIKIQYQDIIGYIQLSKINMESEEGLAEEFDHISNTNRIIFEKMQYIQSEKSQKMFWGIIITGLVVAVFAAGIVSTVIKKKGNEKANEHNK